MFVRVGRYSAFFCALALLLCALISHPVAEIGANDDFAYMRSAKILAETGRIAYVGWSSAMLGWQLALGAAFIKLFGFSFTVTRISILCVGMFTAALLQRTAVRLGLTEWNATLVTLALVLSPLYLSLSLSFMSDIPGLLAIVAALYCCARAVQARTSRSTAGWLIAGLALSTLLGTARQTGWLGALVLVPCTCWILRTRRLPWPAIAAAWVACALAIFGCLRWFSHQMYSTAESAPMYKPGTGQAFETVLGTARLPLELAFFLAPLLVAFVPEFFRGSRKVVWAVLGVSALVCGFFLLRLHGYWASVLLVPAATGDGNYVTAQGILVLPSLGLRPMVLSPGLRLFASIVCYFSAAAFLAVIACRWQRRGSSKPEQGAPATQPPQVLSLCDLLFLVGSFAVVYCGMMAVRIVDGNLFDRYLLPVAVVFAFPVARFYQERVRTQLPVACYAILLAIAVFSVAGVHDMFAADRARVAAIHELRNAGVSPSEMYAGFAYDGWTQIDNQGYIDVDAIRTPSGIHHIPAAQENFKPCGYWPAAFFPTIHPKYAISYDDTACDPAPQRFPPVPYRLWLPPYAGAFYIRGVSPARLAASAMR